MQSNVETWWLIMLWSRIVPSNVVDQMVSNNAVEQMDVSAVEKNDAF